MTALNLSNFFIILAFPGYTPPASETRRSAPQKLMF